MRVNESNKKLSFSMKLNKNHSSLPNIKTAVCLTPDCQTQTVKFDLSNIKVQRNRNKTTTIHETDDDVDDQKVIIKNPIIRQGSNLSKISNNDFEQEKLLNSKKKQFDEESSSHQTAQSGRTFSDSEIIGNAVNILADFKKKKIYFIFKSGKITKRCKKHS